MAVTLEVPKNLSDEHEPDQPELKIADELAETNEPETETEGADEDPDDEDDDETDPDGKQKEKQKPRASIEEVIGSL